MPLQPIAANAPTSASDPNAAAMDALAAMGTLVQTALNLEPQPQTVAVRYLPDEPDYSISWKKTALEERPYWPPFPEAVAYLAASADSPSARLSLMNQMMDASYELDVRPLESNDLDARNARSNFRDLSYDVSNLSYYAGNNKISFTSIDGEDDDTLSYSDFCQTAQGVATQLNGIVRYLSGISGDMAANACVAQCAQVCQALAPLVDKFGQSLPSLQAKDAITTFIATLTPAMPILSGILNGYATIYNNEHLPYIFIERLSLNYTTDPTQSDSRSYATIAGAHLTAFLHKQDWLFPVMQWAVTDLAQALAPFGDKVCFFLKGGRGLQYLLGKPQDGTGDWDTQILIDPTLPWDKWWETYRDVRDVVNNCLARYNFVISATLMAQASALMEATASATAALTSGSGTDSTIFGDIYSLAAQATLDDQAYANDHELVLDNAQDDTMWRPGGNSRAELLDVGLPRYWSIDLLAQWTTIRPAIAQASGIPCPPARYFIEDCIGMIRECDADVSPVPAKRAQRLDRLLRALSATTPDLASYLATQKTATSLAGLTQCPAQIAALSNTQVNGLATVLLGQFCTAYELTADPNLAAAFDGLAAGQLNPTAINAATTATDQANLVFTWCEAISNQMAAHLAARGRMVTNLSMAIADLVSQTAQNVSFRLNPVAEGLFAAQLQAQLADDGTAMRNQVAPAPYASVALYLPDCLSPQDITADMISSLGSIVSLVAGNSPYFGGVLKDTVSGIIRIFAKQPLPLGSTSYAPLAALLTPKPVSAVLRTVAIPQWTFLDFGPLEWWCRNYAAAANQLDTNNNIIETIGSIVEMRSSYDAI
ncbi:hypothetical protein [Azospirillum sp. B4]|uniref:hypothetical protein n=1 Tax=Azospirillum sp. B4 TaxID=95605 RepID=UPI000347DDD1|nr:hypothetical protein [Azospirillum sp. B4]